MSILVLLPALLVFTWAPRTSFAQPIPPPPPMEFHPKPDSSVWILGSLDFIGFGGGRLGPVFAAYGGEAHVWLTPHLGIGARVSEFAAGEPDGRGASGLLFAGMFSARTKVVSRTRQSAWLFGSLGVGSIRLKGYGTQGPGNQPFDEHDAFGIVRAGFMGEYGPLAYGIAFEAVIVPNSGGAGSPILFAGFAF